MAGTPRRPTLLGKWGFLAPWWRRPRRASGQNGGFGQSRTWYKRAMSVTSRRSVRVPAEFPLPPKPKLRNLEPRWVRLRGERRLWLRDPLRLTETATLVPVWLVPLLPALDGTADLPALARRFARET